MLGAKQLILMQIEAQRVPDSRSIGLSESHHPSVKVSLGSGDGRDQSAGHQEAGPDDDI